eukprot:10430210-Karenia_brevis.AAC.1
MSEMQAQMREQQATIKALQNKVSSTSSAEDEGGQDSDKDRSIVAGSDAAVEVDSSVPKAEQEWLSTYRELSE